MTYQRFEDVPVWQKAGELYEATEELLENRHFVATQGFKDQLDRASPSVSNNITEGFERGTTNEFLAFIYIARGSAGEVRSMLCLKERRAAKDNWSEGLKSQISDFEIHGRELLSPIAWMGRCSPEFRNQGSATFNQNVEASGRTNETRNRGTKRIIRETSFDSTPPH